MKTVTVIMWSFAADDAVDTGDRHVDDEDHVAVDVVDDDNRDVVEDVDKLITLHLRMIRTELITMVLLLMARMNLPTLFVIMPWQWQ